MRLPSCRSTVALLLLAAPVFAHAQITVSRESVVLNPAVAAERAATFTIKNAGPVVVPVQVELQDWDMDASGQSHWRKEGTVAGSCGRRVLLSPAALKLAPGEERVVHVALDSNAKFDGECWSAAVVRAVGAGAASVVGSTPTTVPLYVTPTGADVDGELSDMFLKGDSLEIVYRNTGKTRTTIVGEVQVQAAGDSVVATVPLDSATVLVGATRRYRVAVPQLPRGKYLLVALIDFGGEQLTAVQTTLEIR